IESGLDIPNVNTIIINRADRFGLAELHQLRGRVGRSDKQAFAYLLVPSLTAITKTAVKRLQAIEEHSEIGEGFNLSMRDLEIRGAGNILGTEQSGAIESVGFELYVKLLDEAVQELKQNEFSDIFKDLPKMIERSEPVIDAYFKLFIPEDYMPDESARLSFYKAFFTLIKIEDLEEIKEEMLDRFGQPPEIVELLIQSAILRFHASFCLFEKIIIQKEKAIIILPEHTKEEYYKDKFQKLVNYIFDNYKKNVQIKQDKKNVLLEIEYGKKNKMESLEYLIKFCSYAI
ncbi:MAG: transcription-repair coupling factor, partial [Ignavibacteriales bacterium]|nr:transcription-repair coupling factor [Ignavibacteriales bacterium]